MQNKKYLIISFIVAFSLSILAVFYYDYTQQNKKRSINNIQKAFEILSDTGIEVAYTNLNIIKNPSYIDFIAQNVALIGINNSFNAQNAKLTTNNQGGYSIVANNINTKNLTTIKKATFTSIQNNLNLVLEDVDIKGVLFDKVDILGKTEGKNFEISQVIIDGNNLSIIAQGECEFNYSDDYSCRLKTSSKGLLELLAKLEENKLFTSRGVYVTNLVLRSQTSQRTIAPMTFNPQGFYINNILMTSQKNLDNNIW